MKRQNYRKHKARCVYRVEVKMKRSDIVRLRDQPLEPVSVVSMSSTDQVAFGELKHYLTESYHKSHILYLKFIEGNNMSPEQKLNELHIGESTKQNYLLEWRLYLKWLTKHKKSPGGTSANSYLASLQCKASTLRKKQYTLQLVLQHVIDSSIRLNKVRKRITVTPKYALSDKELHDYLEEQKGIDTEDYLIQRLLAAYALRINSTALLKVKHLEFLNNPASMLIHIPDSKVKRHRVEKIDDDLAHLLEEHVGGDRLEESFVFYKDGSKHDDKRRAHTLSMRINKRLKETAVLNKNPNYKYTSHMFRKTKAYNRFQEGIEKLKEEIRMSIGQASQSTAVESYIY